MTNPPYILDHLEEMAEILKHPRVYRFLHVPVQVQAKLRVFKSSSIALDRLAAMLFLETCGESTQWPSSPGWSTSSRREWTG